MGNGRNPFETTDNHVSRTSGREDAPPVLNSVDILRTPNSAAKAAGVEPEISMEKLSTSNPFREQPSEVLLARKPEEPIPYLPTYLQVPSTGSQGI